MSWIRNPPLGVILLAIICALIGSKIYAGSRIADRSHPVIFRSGSALVRIDGLVRFGDGYRMQLADELVVTVSLSVSTKEIDVSCTWPREPSWHIEVKDVPHFRPAKGAKWEWSAAWYVGPMSRGKLLLPLPQLEYTQSADSVPTNAQWPAVYVVVMSSRDKAALDDIEDALPLEFPEQAKASGWTSMLWVGIGIAIFASVAIVVLRVFLLAGGKPATPPTEDKADSHLSRLQEALAAKSFDVDRFLNDFHHYLCSLTGDGRWEGELTPAELYWRLEESGELPPERISAIVSWFEKCEEARYAPTRPDRRTCIEWFNAVRSVVPSESPSW